MFLHRASQRPDDNKMQEVGQTDRPSRWEEAETSEKPVSMVEDYPGSPQGMQPKPWGVAGTVEWPEVLH